MGQKVLLAGDVHADYSHFKYLVKTAVREGCAKIVALGDFGYWPNSKGSAGDFVPRADQLVGKHGITLYWLEGNHEDFGALEKKVNLMAAEPQKMLPNTWYLGRGCQWEWSGRTFMSFGGAHSVDKEWRTEGFDWFAHELPSYEEQSFGLSRPKVDILLTHDGPYGTVPFIDEDNDQFNDVYPENQENRKFIDALVGAVQPKALFHGHHHMRYAKGLSTSYGFMTLDALDCNGSYDKSWLILSL